MLHLPYRIVLLIATLALFSACSKTMTIPLPEEPSRPVLSAFLRPDSIIVASATLSGRYDHFDGTVAYAEEVVIRLYEDDVYLETLQETSDTSWLNRKYYVSSNKAKSGSKYRLTLECKGHDMAEGSDRVPVAADLTVGNQSMLLTPNQYNFFDFHFNFSVTNDGDAPRYYRFRMRAITNSFYVQPNGDTSYYVNETLVPLQTNNTSLSFFSGGNDPMVGGVFANNPLSPGSQQFYNLKVADFGPSGSVGNTERDSFILEVFVLSDDAYQYLYSFNNAVKNTDDPTAERQNVTGNVKNGFGIVGGMAVQEVVFTNP